jgi:outer membrane protein
MISFGFVGAAAALLTVAAPAAAQVKVGFVNTQRVLAEAPGVQQAQRTLQGELTRLRAPLDSLEQRLNTANQQYQQQQASLTPQVRQQREAALQQQFQAYQERGQQLQQQAQQREQQLVAPVMQQINAAIEAERAAGGYTYIMDSSQGGIVAVDPAADLTTRVIARLGGRAAAPAGPTRP